MVIVEEDHDWCPCFSTDPNATPVEIIEAFADRATIEQDFHDVKEVWGAGQQQVRNIWTDVAVYHLNLWMHTLVELWSWNRAHGDLTDRRMSIQLASSGCWHTEWSGRQYRGDEVRLKCS